MFWRVEAQLHVVAYQALHRHVAGLQPQRVANGLLDGNLAALSYHAGHNHTP
jgi:hypothetical protein